MSLWGKIFGLQKNPHYEEGIKHFNEGRYELAVEELEKAVENVGKGDPIYALGKFYAAESHAHIGIAKYHSGDVEGALSHFKEAVQENPTYPDLYYRMGVIYHRMGSPEEAVGMLRRAIELNNSYFEAVTYLGIVCYEKGEKEEADLLFKKALDIGTESPSPVSKFLSDHLAGREVEIPPLSSLGDLMRADTKFDSLVKEGIEAFNTGNFENAAHSFREASGIHPDYADIRFKFGLALLRGGSHEFARKELESALSINPKYTEARFYLGVTYLDQKQYHSALTHFEQASTEEPGYADLQCFLGTTYFYLGEFGKAREALERSMELSPRYCKARYYYGLLLYTLGEHGRAVEHLVEAMGSKEARGAARLSLALVHLREGNLEEAMAVLHDMIEAGSNSADVLYFVGEVYLRMGKTAEAERFFRQSLDVNPEFLKAKEKLALIMIRCGDYSGAEEILEPLREDFADLHKILGDVKFLKGDLDAAERLYRKSLEINTEYYDAYLALALTLRKKGLEGDAEGILQRVLELDPENVVARSLLGRGPLDFD